MGAMPELMSPPPKVQDTVLRGSDKICPPPPTLIDDGNMHAFKCMLLFLVPQNTSEHISSMLVYFPDIAYLVLSSPREGLRRTVQAGYQPFYLGPFVLSSSRKVRICLPVSSGFSSQLPVNRCMKIHAHTASKYSHI